MLIIFTIIICVIWCFSAWLHLWHHVHLLRKTSYKRWRDWCNGSR